MSEPAFVVLMRVHLHFPDVASLKGKRAELNRVKAHLRERCGASVAEVAHQDMDHIRQAYRERSAGLYDDMAPSLALDAFLAGLARNSR